MTGYFMMFLNWINGWVGNYGWSIVVFTLIIRLILLPLDIKSKKSMRAMTRIQPKMAALQAKYANDRDKLNQKMSELYRKEHVSPMSGCLPLLIQMPILFIMFAAMRTVGNERTVSMILGMKETGTLEAGVLQGWLWIKNVFQPDSFSATILPPVGDTLRLIQPSNSSAILTAENIDAARAFLASDAYNAIAVNYAPASAFVHFKLNLLFFAPTITLPNSFASLMQYANGLFILPLLAGFSQFFMTQIMNGQQKQEKKDENAVQTVQQKQQEDAAAAANAMNSPMMKWFFPIFSIWICATSNAAFSIYWMAANVIQIVQQLGVNAYFKRQDDLAAKAQSAGDPS
ncbi:MAG: YidC/Oxa1 family membrane protein insertase [Clostridia bacterium]|nr:YidC/Oxa1 family membrane protein insertase [Clostridia bacterium]